MAADAPLIEFNGLPEPTGHQQWLTTWYDAIKPQFRRLQDAFWNKDATKLIGGLFLESLQVSWRSPE